jgi:CHAD domain-containing protein
MRLSNSQDTFAAKKQFGFDVWMGRVAERAQSARKDWGRSAAHDLRVALRRCRTMADALDEIAPDPRWRKVKKKSRELFHVLGKLRDAQVEQGWVERLAPPGGKLRSRMLRLLARRERKCRAAAERALDRFAVKGWQKLARRLAPKAGKFPAASIGFQSLALARLDEVVELYNRARGGRDGDAWHRLRIGLKRFRYVVENFVPQHYEAWAPELKRIQDSLGDVHDLDELRIEIERRSGERKKAAATGVLTKIAKERGRRLSELRAHLSESRSPWNPWRAELHGGSVSIASPGPRRARRGRA